MCFAGNRDGEHDAGCGNEALCILHLRKARAEPHHRFLHPIDFRSAFYEQFPCIAGHIQQLICIHAQPLNFPLTV